MRNRISNKPKDRYKKSMSNVINGLSRKVHVYKQPIRHECPNCYFDQLTNKSTGKCKWTLEEATNKQIEQELISPGVILYKYFVVGRCPICKGVGYLETKRKTTVDCLVIWNPTSRFTNNTTLTPAGTEGSIVLQLKTDPKYESIFEESVKIVVDGVECVVEKPLVNRGLGNSTVLIINAFTNDKPNKTHTTLTKDYK